MAESGATAVAASSPRVNVTDRLAHYAALRPSAVAVASAQRSGYATTTFAELDADATRIARGLVDWGIAPGRRLALLVTPGIEFVTLVFALLRAGVVIVLVDPGIGRKNLIRCLEEVKPEGFVAIPKAQAVRMLVRHKFPQARWNVTVGRRWFWGGVTLEASRRRGDRLAKYPDRKVLPQTSADDPAAIIFTSGSTGPPKGVLYTHGMFDAQVAEIQSQYSIQPGGIDLACFPLFALFNSAMGVTTVLPRMDFSRPASALNHRLLQAANDWQVTQAFASPAVWQRLGEHCKEHRKSIGSLHELFSCGAPVTAEVLELATEFVAPGAKMHTPYGATECLPVATIEAAEVLSETAAATNEAAGVCVGRKFSSIDWRVIRITDEPITSIADAEELPQGEIGELIVRGRQASPAYVTRVECNATAKIADADGAWHRMGDAGYFDSQGRFWYCGRKSHRVETASGPLYTECVEGVFNAHRLIKRSALVGLGAKGRQTPVLIVEPKSEGHIPIIAQEMSKFAKHENALTKRIKHFLPLAELPVDIRHNAKIHREQLAEWAATKLPELA